MLVQTGNVPYQDRLNAIEAALNELSNKTFKDPTAAGSATKIAVKPTAVTGRYNAISVEAYLAPEVAGVATASPVGCYALRGVAGVAAGYTVAGGTACYLAGAQGKLDVVGTLGSGAGSAIYACGALAQVSNGGGTFGSEVQVYGLWVDNQRATAGEGSFHLLNITNNGGTIDNVFFVYGNNAIADQVFNLNTMGSAVVAITGNASNQTKALKIKLDGVQWYVPLQSGTS